MKIISWNVNGLKSIIKKGFKRKINKLDADIICIQETKICRSIKGFELEGYYCYNNYSSKPGYSGVAIFSRKKANKVIVGFGVEKEAPNEDTEARVLTLEFNDFYIVNVYVPHPQTNNLRKDYREKFNKKFFNYIKSLRKSVIICGDFNVCHKNIDIYSLKASEKDKEFLIEQRNSFSELLEIGLIDTYRYMHPQMRKYTFKANNIQKTSSQKYGWRLDYILISNTMRKEIREANILNNVNGSDHCPIELVLRLSNGMSKTSLNDKVLYMPIGYYKKKELNKIRFIKDSFDNDILGDLWQNFNFEKAEETLLEKQCELTKATLSFNTRRRIEIQEEIAHSTEAKMLAVRKVSEISKAGAGIDGEEWVKSSDKMRAVINLKMWKYKAKPLRQFVFHDVKAGKDRKVGVPTVFDRTMQVLYSYTLEPVEEALGDRKSFAFRKGRSSALAHTHLIKALREKNAPQWILVSDVKSYYNSISHQWIIDNIPMNKAILYEFVKSKFVLNGELFDTESGVSLGSNISTIIGNMTLDGLQRKLYNLQGKKISDFGNGMCFRFADDIVTLARSKEDAQIFKKEIENFVNERGLILSNEKTKIVNIKEGFDFISRFYYKSDGMIKCVPSEKAVFKFEKEIEELIMNNYERWTLRKLVDRINSKITGFSTYHKIEDSKDVFKYLDVVITALLLKLVKRIHPTYTDKQLINKYWSKDGEGRDVFSTAGGRKKYVKFMADTILVEEKTIDLKKNIFLDRKYFMDLQKDREIQNCIGRYRRVYDRQEGLCYFCSKPIRASDEKKIIYKQKSKDRTVRNMAYIHTDCENQLLTEIKVDEDITNSITVKELLKEYSEYKITKKKYSKFRKLTEYFFNSKKKKITLKIKTIEKILGFKLCDSAYKYKTYYLSNKDGLISDSWRLNGYKVENVDLEKQEISFKKTVYGRSKIIIPKELYNSRIPKEVIDEVNSSLLHIVKKYRLKC